MEAILHPSKNVHQNVQLLDSSCLPLNVNAGPSRAPSSIHSNSASHAMRIKVAQERARIRASREASITSQKLEEEELRIRRQRKELEETKLDREMELLKEELEMIDRESHLPYLQTSVFQRHRHPLIPQEPIQSMPLQLQMITTLPQRF